MNKLMRMSALALVLCGGMAAMAMPAKPVTRLLPTDDGSEVRVTLTGDEFGHYWMDEQGEMYMLSNGVLRRKTGEEKQAVMQKSEALRTRANEQRAQVAARRRAAVASATADTMVVNLAPRGLVVLANFSDKRFRAENTRAEFDSMLNAVNYTYYKSYGSARKYFQDQSMGQYNPQFDVVGPVTLPHNEAYYGENDAEGNDKMCGQMVIDAVQLASAMPGVSMSNYDNDNDGFVDFVYIITAGFGENSGGDEDGMWPASWDVSSAIYYGYTELSTNQADNYARYTFGGKVLDRFAFSSELNYDVSTYSRTYRDGIGTFCHEFSHVVGLPDYYDISYGSNHDNNKTPGWWSLMDIGSYTEDGYIPLNYSAHDKWFVGWVTPQTLDTTRQVTLPADGRTYYYITANGEAVGPRTPQTVYYLENRQKTGWDQGLPGHGMLVWRVKYDENVWYNNEPNISASRDNYANTSGELHFTVVPAKGDATVNSSNQDTYPGSTNKTTFTAFTGVTCTNISEQGGIITLQFNRAGSGTGGGGNGQTPGECPSYAWTASSALATGMQTLGDKQWQIAVSGGEYLGYESNRGAQFGSGSKPCTKVSLTTDEEACVVSSITVEACSASGGTGMLEVYIGGQQTGERQSLSTLSSEYVFNNTAGLTGALEIRYLNTQKALFLKSIEIVYGAKTGLEEAAEAEEVVGIYSLTGVPMGNELSILPQGMYIVVSTTGTKKIIK